MVEAAMKDLLALERWQSLAGVPVSVLGLARSGLAAATVLAARGADVLVSDPKEEMLKTSNMRYIP